MTHQLNLRGTLRKRYLEEIDIFLIRFISHEANDSKLSRLGIKNKLNTLRCHFNLEFRDIVFVVRHD